MKNLAPLLALFALSGCIIGTWPTPEAREESANSPTRQATAEDNCDGTDNDSDGVIDEGCSCDSGDLRGCVGIAGGRCGLGVQQCRRGLWGGCESVGPPYSATLDPDVTILNVDPPALVRGGTEAVRVTAHANAACAGIQVARVEASLTAAEPAVRVVAVALDNGVPPDAEAGDGEHTAVLPNAFGPGVPAQTLTLRAAATVGDREVGDQITVELQEP